jgi:hypothetical protein
MSVDSIAEMETLQDLVAAGRERGGRVLDIESRPAPYTYRDLCTNVWKAGNLFCHYGVHVEGELDVAVGPKAEVGGREMAGYIDASESLLAVLGGGFVGGSVDIAPTEPVETSVLVAPDHWEMEVTPRCTSLAYGGPPTEPDVEHFERNVWSENPIEPPESVRPDQTVVRFESGVTLTHHDLLASAAELISEYQLDETTTVSLTAPLTDPGALVAGLVAPLAAGATIVVPELAEDGGSYQDTVRDDIDVVVTTETGDSRHIGVDSVTDSLL